MKITNIDILNDIAKNALRRKTVFVNQIARYRTHHHNMLVQLLHSAGLDECRVMYEYGKGIDNEPIYIKGKLSVELYSNEFNVTNPYAILFDGGCIKHWFLTDSETDYFAYLINEVFPKMRKIKD